MRKVRGGHSPQKHQRHRERGGRRKNLVGIVGESPVYEVGGKYINTAQGCDALREACSLPKEASVGGLSRGTVK